MSSKRISRRSIIRTAASVGALGIGTGSAVATSENNPHFTERGWVFDVQYPDDFQALPSKAQTDEPNYYSINSESDVLKIHGNAPSRVNRIFNDANSVSFEADGEFHHSGNKHDQPRQTELELLPTTLGEDTRVTEALLLNDAIQLPRPHVRPEGRHGNLIIDTPNERTTVLEQQSVSITHEPIEIAVKERIPPADPRNSKQGAIPDSSERTVTVTPTFVVNNHGPLGVVKSDNSGGK